MLLPAEHEIDQERNERERQHKLSYFSKILRKQVRAAAVLDLYSWHILRGFGFLRQDVFGCLFQGFGLLPETGHRSADPLRVPGQLLKKIYRSVIEEVARTPAGNDQN